MHRYLDSLSGKTAIVTGASSGLGRATAVALAARGVRVFLTARREERLRDIQEQIVASGGQAGLFAGDASHDATAQSVLEHALQSFGRVDLLINNAGQGIYKKLVETSVDEYDQLMNANMRSSFLMSRVVVPGMIAQRSGTIVFISSVAGITGRANEAVYAATKFAQVGFAQSLDEELRGYGIKVCALCPGGMKTEFAIGRGRTQEVVAGSRMMAAEEVAESVVYACSQPPNVRLVQLTVRNMGEPYE